MAATAPSPEAAAACGALVPARFRVVGSHAETADVQTLELEPLDGPPLAALPGQFTMLTAFGVGESAISVTGDPARAGPLTHTIRAVGPVTRALCAARPGSVVGVRGPFGRGWPLEEAEGADVVLVAGGVGLPPLRPVVHEALARPERYGTVSVLYGSRTPADLVFADLLPRWAREGVDVAVTVDAAPAGWDGRVGLVTSLVGPARFDPGSAVAFVCGPEGMLRFVAAALAERGLPPSRVWVSLERSMQCGVGLCGHCQLGPLLVCRDGPVFRLDEVARWLEVREL